MKAPRIAGQSDRYVRGQLEAYANGSRDDGGTGMAAVAKAMSQQEIDAIATYLSGTQEVTR
jgi:cytochrome c553